jgi:hypothetical protein
VCSPAVERRRGRRSGNGDAPTVAALGSAATTLHARRGWGGGAGCVGVQARLILGGEGRGGAGKAVERWSSVEAAMNGLEALSWGEIKVRYMSSERD